MDDIELDLFVQLYDAILAELESDQVLLAADLKEWHRRWLGNVYDWAGQYRTVNMAKGQFHFAATAQIERLMNELNNKYLSRYTPCHTMDEERLVEAIAAVHIELILVHPFREGNGRLSRLLANVMALQASKPELDFTYWDEHKDDYFAAIQAGLDNSEPMQALVRRVLHDVGNDADD